MANLGTTWHIPSNPEPRGRSDMRDPVFPTNTATGVTITSGNQFSVGGNPGNQLQDGSALLYRSSTDAAWTEVPLLFDNQTGNNKYFSARIPAAALVAGAVLRYYLRIAYDDHNTTFLLAAGDGTTSATTADENDAQAAAFTFTVETPEVRGQWGPLFALPNVGIHAHLLPTGKVLMWGRRDSPDQSLDTDPPGPIQIGGPVAPPARSTPFLWDPTTGQANMTPLPTLGDAAGTAANLFCAGHAFLPDGRLLVAGGHLADGAGLDRTTLYDPAANTWTPGTPMKHGRWYPTLACLPDGSVVVISGSYRWAGATVNNTAPELWRDGTIAEIADCPAGAFDLYPRLHVASDGAVVTTGALQQTWSLDVSGGGQWKQVPTQRTNGQRDYAPSVLYDVDKVVYIGGGNAPTANAEQLDLSVAVPQWNPAGSMAFARRQHNATILADGTVLVTGGTRSGGGDPPQNFNNLDLGQPIHVAELWNPGTGAWVQLAAEDNDRCYHSTAVLLPDGTVLSAGGGDFFPVEGVPAQNDPLDTNRDAQIFSPPYLFKGARPTIATAPDAVAYGQTYQVDSVDAATITKITWIRLSSVTHSFNSGQRLNVLPFQSVAGGLQVTAPASAEVCPPGHYMLFLINGGGVPSLARIVQIAGPAAGAPVHAFVQPAAAHPHLNLLAAAPAAPPRDAFAQRSAMLAANRAKNGTSVLVGLRGTCPYGIAACWGGANEALARLDGVHFVDPIPDGEASTATVFLSAEVLPALDQWREQFRRIVNDSYAIRGVELSLTGSISVRDGHLFLVAEGGTTVRLAPLTPADKVQWDRTAQAPQVATSSEVNAFAALRALVSAHAIGTITVAGPLHQEGARSTLEVRLVTV